MSVPTRGNWGRGWWYPFLAVVGGCLLTTLPTRAADEGDRLKVGLQPDGRIVVPTNQILKPAGAR